LATLAAWTKVANRKLIRRVRPRRQSPLTLAVVLLLRSNARIFRRIAAAACLIFSCGSGLAG
jgi:hypothetical protein